MHNEEVLDLINENETLKAQKEDRDRSIDLYIKAVEVRERHIKEKDSAIEKYEALIQQERMYFSFLLIAEFISFTIILLNHGK